MCTEKKLFAFKLAEKQAKNANQNNAKWKARDGVAIAGCSVSTTGHLYPMATTGDFVAPCI